MHTLNNDLNDEEMITCHLMCVMKQLSYDKNIMFEDRLLKDRRVVHRVTTSDNEWFNE